MGIVSKDTIDEILDQWSEERPELDTAALGVVIRVMTLYRRFSRQATRALGRPASKTASIRSSSSV